MALRRAAVNLAVLLASTAVALLGAELVVRTFDLFAKERAAVGESNGGVEPAPAPPSEEPVTNVVVHPFLGWSVRPGIFKDEERTIYVDDCCHVNKLGNQIMGKEVGRILAEVLRPDSAR